jgi:hypothetical protein
MLLKILLIFIVITSLGGMVYSLYRVITNNSRPDVLHNGVMNFALFGMVFLISGVFTTFYLLS